MVPIFICRTDISRVGRYISVYYDNYRFTESELKRKGILVHAFPFLHTTSLGCITLLFFLVLRQGDP